MPWLSPCLTIALNGMNLNFSPNGTKRRMVDYPLVMYPMVAIRKSGGNVPLTTSGRRLCIPEPEQAPGVRTHRQEGPPFQRRWQQRSRLMEEWHPTLNVGVSPEELLPGTHRKVWWKCSKGHEWRAQVKSRVQGSGCPVCSNRKINVMKMIWLLPIPRSPPSGIPRGMAQGHRTPWSVDTMRRCGGNAKRAMNGRRQFFPEPPPETVVPCAPERL